MGASQRQWSATGPLNQLALFLELEPAMNTPCDSAGAELKPLDLVIIEVFPEYFFNEPGSRYLPEEKWKYGLITYTSEGEDGPQRYHLGNKDHPGWCSGDGKIVHVLSHANSNLFGRGDEIWVGEFWMPTNCLRKIPFNSLIMNIFSEYPWSFAEPDDQGNEYFVREGMPEHQWIKTLLDTPYEKLCAAHEAAMRVINEA